MRDVVGFEGLYKVTEDGKIWSCRRNRFLHSFGKEDEYQMIALWTTDKKQVFDYVHRIVAKAYIPNPNNYPEVNHKDEVKSHNHYTNLEWCTRSYNLCYGTRPAKIRAALKNNANKLGVARKIYCEELDRTFMSTSEAARELGVKQPNVSATCYGKQKTCGGYHLRFAN